MARAPLPQQRLPRVSYRESTALTRTDVGVGPGRAAGTETVEAAFTDGVEPGPTDGNPAVWDSTFLDWLCRSHPTPDVSLVRHQYG
ncbi:hypothetical protein OHA25_16990 [Nonomuraea sp. NBC_00507]|uniref:hypothetical protein n=1 Tax=Nonomuraea sp. NBC_00507 TaxID=2976002 RepID=UPI002E1860A1